MNALPARWGPGLTAAWSLAVMALFVLVQTLFAGIYLAATKGNLPPERAAEEMRRIASNGDVAAVATFLSTPACLLALFVIVKLKRGAVIDDTFALRVPDARTFVRWLLVLIAFAALSDGLTWILGRPIVPEYMRSLYGSADGKGALWVAMVVAAPVFEEALFRGYLITGLAASRLGASGAILVASLAWALIHSQYDAYGVATIFVMGILLGAARVRTGSLLVPLAMHMLMNLIATIEAAVL